MEFFTTLPRDFLRCRQYCRQLNLSASELDKLLSDPNLSSLKRRLYSKFQEHIETIDNYLKLQIAQQGKLTRTALQRRFLKHLGFTNFINFSTIFVNIRQPVICGVLD
jgi:hypothetical protein